MSDLGYPMIQAHPDAWDAGRQGYSIIWIIVHCTDQAYQDNYPERLGQYWSRPPTGSPVSVHYGVSDTQTYQYVWHRDTAYQARNPGNVRGVGIEFSGLSSYPPSTWNDHDAMLRRGGTLISQIADEHDIPLEYLSPQELRDRKPGITTHAMLTATFGGTHTDPGHGFPYDTLLSYAKGQPPAQEDDMGHSFPPMPIPAGPHTSFTIPPTAQGDADPCYQWINIGVDSRGQQYALRIAVGNESAQGGWSYINEKLVLKSGQRWSHQLKPGDFCVDFERVPVNAGEQPYQGSLSWCLERKSVK